VRDDATWIVVFFGIAPSPAGASIDETSTLPRAARFWPGMSKQKQTKRKQKHRTPTHCTDSCGHAERCAVPAKLSNCPCPRRGAPDAATGACRDDGRHSSEDQDDSFSGDDSGVSPELVRDARNPVKPEPGLARAHRMSGGGSPDFAHRTCCGCGA